MPLIDENAEVVIEEPEEENPLPLLSLFRDEIQACIVLIEEYKKKYKDEKREQFQLAELYFNCSLFSLFFGISGVTVIPAVILCQYLMMQHHKIHKQISSRGDYYFRDFIEDKQVIQRLTHMNNRLGLHFDHIGLLESLNRVAKNLYLKQKCRLTFLNFNLSKKLPQEVQKIILYKANLLPDKEEDKKLILERKEKKDSVSTATSMFAARKRKRNNPVDVTCEEMAKSAFGQGSYTSKQM